QKLQELQKTDPELAQAQTVIIAAQGLEIAGDETALVLPGMGQKLKIYSDTVMQSLGIDPGLVNKIGSSLGKKAATLFDVLQELTKPGADPKRAIQSALSGGAGA